MWSFDSCVHSCDAPSFCILINTVCLLRRYWLSSKLAEAHAGDAPSPRHRYRFLPAPVYAADVEGLRTAYAAPLPFARDGLQLLHRRGPYVLGPTPLVLLWKDANCSRYFVDTDVDGNVPERQQVVLRLLPGAAVGTSDDPPLILGRIPQDFLEKNAGHLREGSLLRFSIGADGLAVSADGHPCPVEGPAGLQFEGAVRGRRRGADSASKVIFQHTARSSRPLAFEELLLAAGTTTPPVQLPEAGDTAMDSS